MEAAQIPAYGAMSNLTFFTHFRSHFVKPLGSNRPTPTKSIPTNTAYNDNAISCKCSVRLLEKDDKNSFPRCSLYTINSSTLDIIAEMRSQ